MSSSLSGACSWLASVAWTAFADAGLLDSALGRPLQLLNDGSPTLFALAAGEIDADAFSAWLAQSCSPR